MSLLDHIRARKSRIDHSLGLRVKDFATQHPELINRQHLYSSEAFDQVSEAADNYVGYARLYDSYVWVRKAVKLISENFAPLTVRVVDKDGKAVASHPLTALLAEPNDTQSPAQLWGISTVYLLLGGERILEIVDDEAGRPRELWARRPDRVGIRPDETRPGYPKAAEYILQDLVRPDFDGTVPYEAVIFERFANPLNEWRGLGFISAVRAGITLDLLAQGYTKGVLRNQARPDYVITTDESLTPDERKRMEIEVEQKYGNPFKRNRPMVLEAGQDVKPLSFPPKDVEWLEQRYVSRDEVAAVFGVPDILMGFGNDSYDTEEKRNAAMAVLWALTILPLVEQRDGTLTWFFSKVRPMLRPGERIASDLSQVAVLQEALQPKLDAAGKLFSMGVPFNTIDKLLRLNIGPIPGGNVGYLAANLLPADDLGGTGAAGPALSAPAQLALQRAMQKRRPAPARIAQSLQRIRLNVARKMEKDVDQYFDDLADTVVARAREADKSARLNGRRSVLVEYTDGNGAGQVSTIQKLPQVGDLLLRTDEDALRELFSSFTVTMLQASWETWNLALALEVGFDMNDPAVVAALAQSGDRIKDITDTTKDALRELLQFGAENAWTIDQLVSGNGVRPGLRDVVAQTYEGRGRAIARTELGNAQQVASVQRYRSAGLDQVLVLDNGQDDPDDACAQINGTVQTLAWAEKNRLEHPNCTRCFAPHFD